MTIKLVRTDTISPCKINLPKGEHVFGRGKLLDCNDKRISREHGQIIVSDDSLTIKSLHLNPCFFQKKQSTQTEILKLNNTTVLNNGDRFGLLPDSYWFEILVCYDESKHCTEANSENDTEELCLEQGGCETRSEVKNVQPNINLSGDNEDTNVRPESPSLLANTDNGVGAPNNCVSPSEGSGLAEQLHGSDDTQLVTQKVEDFKQSPSKRPHSLDNSEAKKIKTEENTEDEPNMKTEQTVKDEPAIPEDNTEPGVKPGCSTDDTQPAQCDDKQGPVKPAKPRERCMFGAQCYRRNPTHLEQYSHPQDADWGVGARGVCPYGAACRRRNLMHWSTNDHPPGVLPPPRPGKRRPKAPDEDDVPQDLPSKRVRKPVPRPDWVGSDSEPEDPYGTDESDEWKPDSNTNYSDDYI
ncbi:hypothetical protein KGM_212378 [Danaus plexippus plexippus]|uniref:Uncharacterized protein n=1 Tax=Danaus plexippus plexippus TaxID=278856 RepID=A0A212FM02_DANPL|nr:hypothetical protein KGM_212378 [Danaus plexippus plexippus]